MLVTGMLFEFFWIPVVYHHQQWFAQVDMWGMLRAAHFVGWGYLGGVYTTGNGVLAFPGMPILLAPVAMLSGRLGLSESISPVMLAHPTAVFLLLPTELILAGTVLFAADALAEELGSSRGRRTVLCILLTILVWPMVALWGHAEDALVMTFALYGMRAMLRGRWVRTGWLLGFAVVLQPLMALTIPLFLAASPAGQRIRFVCRCAALSVVTTGVAYLGNPSETYRALVTQPGEPSLNHPTPWVALAPRVPDPLPRTHQAALPTVGHHIGSFHAVNWSTNPGIIVSNGPGRMIDVVLALLLGVYVWRRPQAPERLLWLAGLVLASRCFFEAIMTPYYLTPPLILLLVLATRAKGWRFPVTLLVAVVVSRFAYQPLGEWAWWLPVVAALSVIVYLTFPGRAETGGEDGTGSGLDGVNRSLIDQSEHGGSGDPLEGESEGQILVVT
ncbi:MAG TPA: hypothetical protein VIH95_07875 [Acidimicrobiales bacterium]